ncbi:MAG: hypothetical protein NTAFB09_10880 [Nitrosospira sp.]
MGYQSDLNLYAYVGNDPVNNIDSDGKAAQFLVIPAIGGAINALFQGYEASQSGASAYGIAAAAGKGFISGFAGTAAGLAAGAASPALSGAVGGVVENVVNSGLNGKIPDLASVAKSAVLNAALGKGVEKLLPTPRLPTGSPDIYKAPASYSLAPQNAQNALTPAQIATRQIDQTISSGLGGGSVQAVSGLVGRALGKP